MRILWLKTELLHPTDRGGRIRTYFMLRELKRRHHITYVTLEDGTSAPDAKARAAEYCHELVCLPHRPLAQPPASFASQVAHHLTSRLPHFMKKYRSDQMRREIIERDERGDFDIVVSDFLMPSINVPSDLSGATVLFARNIEANIVKRYYQIQRNPLKKAYLYDLWRKTRSFERATCQRFDQVISVSGADSETIRQDYGVATVRVAPTGVDTDYFHSQGSDDRVPHNLVFTGMMNWLPNEDAVFYFANEILPIVKRAVPDVTLTVVGRDPYPRLVELSRQNPSIYVTGQVEDVRPYLERASGFIVPLRVGSGVRLKIYEAMAMGKAVISTSVGAEGLPVEGGVDLLLADTAADFAGAVIRVLTDDKLARELGERAARTVRTRFTWMKAAEVFEKICQRAINDKRSRMKRDFAAISDRAAQYALRERV